MRGEGASLLLGVEGSVVAVCGIGFGSVDDEGSNGAVAGGALSELDVDSPMMSSADAVAAADR